MSDDGKKLEKWGLRATYVYLTTIIFGIPFGALVGILDLQKLKLNELGDFLAGAFGPLAIFWLVLGFFQQGRELRNSVATLELQAKELANSVKQQKELVEATREGIKHDVQSTAQKEQQRKKQMLPLFHPELKAINKSGASNYRFIFKMTNSGHKVSSVSIGLKLLKVNRLQKDLPYLGTGETIEIRDVDLTADNSFPKEDLFLKVSFIDDDEAKHIWVHRLRPPTEENWSQVFEVVRVEKVDTA